MKVVYFHRKPRPVGNFSIESYFSAIRNEMPDEINCVVHQASWLSQGIWQRTKIIREAAKHQGDINHITGDINFVALGLKKEKTILTIHDCAFLEHTKGFKQKILKKIWLDKPIQYARFLTAVSPATKAQILQYTSCKPEDIYVIPTTIDTAFASFAASNPIPTTFNQEKPTILQIGSVANKNLERLFPALEGISCKLKIIAPLTNEQVRLLTHYKIDFEQHDRLTFEELIQSYYTADIVSFVSTTEGFGMPILEAQTVGTTVLTSNVSSMPFAAGEGAHLVNPFSIEEIRNGILKLIEDADYRNMLIEKGKANIERFNPKKVALQYAALYKKIHQQL